MNFSDVCSLCLTHNETFTSHASIDSRAREILECIIPEHVLQGTEIPKQICVECLHSLDRMYIFRQRCLENLSTFNKFAQKLKQDYGSNEHVALILDDISPQQNYVIYDKNHKKDERGIEEPIYKMEEVQIKSEVFDGDDYELHEELTIKEDSCFSANDIQEVKSEHYHNVRGKQDVIEKNMEESIEESVNNPKDLLLPTKSKELYKEEYNIYRKWCLKMNINKTTEDTILAYFNGKLGSYKSSTSWTKYSMLRSTINLNENVDISKFSCLIQFLRRKGEGYKPKKSLTLTKEHVDMFLAKADDKHHLLNKIILIFGIAGACRRQELASLLRTNVEDYNTHFLVRLIDTKTKTDRSFIILPGQFGDLNLLEMIRNYISLRPPETLHNRFFVNFVKEKYTVQPVGVHKIAGVPSLVAKFLNLQNYALYTGHCFRRTSATLLANTGTNVGMKHNGK